MLLFGDYYDSLTLKTMYRNPILPEHKTSKSELGKMIPADLFIKKKNYKERISLQTIIQRNMLIKL